MVVLPATCCRNDDVARDRLTEPPGRRSRALVPGGDCLDDPDRVQAGRLRGALGDEEGRCIEDEVARLVPGHVDRAGEADRNAAAPSARGQPRRPGARGSARSSARVRER